MYPVFKKSYLQQCYIPFGFNLLNNLLTKFLLNVTGIIALGINYIFSLVISDILYNK